MRANKQFELIWTRPAIQDTLVIRSYLEENFSNREINKFLKLLLSFEESVVGFPEMHTEFSKAKKLRRAVLNKNLSVYYKVTNRKITVISVLDNRANHSKLT